MSVCLDHLILAVNDIDASVDFYSQTLGFESEGRQEPFTVLRVAPDFTIQLAPWGTKGGEHLAFAMSAAEFDAVFARVKDAGIEFGDGFSSVGNMQGPGEEGGARGMAQVVYFFDPSRHLIEIRNYETENA